MSKEFTGYKDKNGDPVYVGDKVKMYFYPNEEMQRGETVTKICEVQKGSEEADELLGFKSYQLAAGKSFWLLSPNTHRRIEVIKTNQNS